MCGLRKASGEYVVTMDDDLQNPPEEIRKLIERLEEGFDVVYGIPEDKKHSAFRNFGTAMTDLLFDIICGKPVKVKVGSFRAMKIELVNMISKDETSFVYITAITLKYTKNIGNIKVRHDERKYGSSNYSLKKLLLLFFRLFINYADLPFYINRDSKPQYVIKNQQL
jgi:undecaprenyl-phosphate 4-deoxy-4-formamido-L-arabinose transferase